MLTWSDGVTNFGKNLQRMSYVIYHLPVLIKVH